MDSNGKAGLPERGGRRSGMIGGFGSWWWKLRGCGGIRDEPLPCSVEQFDRRFAGLFRKRR